MKKVIFFLLITNIIISQNFEKDFLDGTIVFKLNNFIENNDEIQTKTSDAIGLIENILNYPDLVKIFENIQILNFERPSYFTNKRELQKIYRIK